MNPLLKIVFCGCLFLNGALSAQSYEFQGACGAGIIGVQETEQNEFYAVVYDFCDWGNFDGYLTRLENGELVPVQTLANRLPLFYEYRENLHWILSRSEEACVFESYDDEFVLQSSFPTPIGFEDHFFKAKIFDDWLICVGRVNNMVQMSRLNLLSGEVEENAYLSGLIPNHTTELLSFVEVADDEYLLLMDCDRVIRFNPFAFGDLDFEPLPINPEGEPYNPCGNPMVKMRPSNLPGVEYVAFSGFGDGFYGFYFNPEGNVEYWLPFNFDQDMYCGDYLEDSNGGYWYSLLQDGDGVQDLRLRKYDAENNILMDDLRVSENELESAYQFYPTDNNLLLFGNKRVGEAQTWVAEVIITNNEGLNVGVDEVNSNQLLHRNSFIHTESHFGAKNHEIKEMQVLDLNGSIVQSKQSSGLWQKDEFERGIYLLRVELSSGEVATWKVLV